MTIREKVARAIRQKTAEIDHRPDIIQPDPMWFADEYVTAAINAFLAAAAEQGWHMRQDVTGTGSPASEFEWDK